MATTITTDSLNVTDPLKTITPTPDMTNYQGIIDQGAADTKASLDKINADKALLTGKTADTAALNETTGVNAANADIAKYTTQLADINASISGLSNEAKAIPLDVQNKAANTGATDAGVAPITTGRLRENAIKALTQSSLADVVTANITGSNIKLAAAQDKVTQAINLKYKPIEDEIANLKDQLQLNKDYITDPAEKKLAAAQQRVLDERTRVLAQQKDLEQNLSSVALEAAKNGASQSVIKAISSAKSIGDAITAAGTSLKTPSTEVVKLGDSQAMLIDKNTGKVLKTYGTAPSTGVNVGGANGAAYSGVLSTILGSGKFTKDQAAAVTNAVNNGQDPFTVIKNNAKNIMGQTEATKLTSLEASRDAFNDFAASLQAYYDAGGDTSLIKGNFEKTINKLGKVNDPNLVTLATQLQGTIQSYRNAISGTAYSDQEGKDIASIFPGITNTKTMNDAIIKGRNKLFDTSIDGIYRSALGGAYDTLKGVEQKNSTAKNGMSDRDYVSKAFTLPANKSAGDYQTVINNTPSGKIPVVMNDTGEIGYIPYTEFNPTRYTKL